MASALLQKTPYGSFGGQPGGTLAKYQGKDLSPSVMDKEELPLTAEELARSLAERDAFKGVGLPTLDLGPLGEFGISDFVTPGGLAKVAAVLKGVLAPAAAVSTAMLVGSRAAGPASLLARTVGEGQAGILKGPLAKTWDTVAAKMAEEMLPSKAPDYIWKKTGTMQSPGDSLLRQEIPDSGLKVKSDFYTNRRTTVGELIDHPELFNAYPELQNLEVMINNKRVGGTSTPPIGSLPGHILIGQTNDPISLLLHELQHQVQSKENFALGGNLGSGDKVIKNLKGNIKTLETEFQDLRGSLDPADLKALEKDIKDQKELLNSFSGLSGEVYNRLAGEVEARAVARRFRMSDSELQRTIPTKSYDEPVDRILKKGDY